MAQDSYIVPRQRDRTNGTYTTAYRDEDFLEAIEAIDGAATTTKILDELGCSQRLALDRLHGLADDGDVTREKIGNAYVWGLDK